MPNQDHLAHVARSVRRELDREGLAFKSLPRMELTERVRKVSGESTTRVKSAMGADLDRALTDQGLRCYPSIEETTTGQWIRVFRAGSAISDLIDAVLVPSPDNDRHLGAALAKVRGSWDWHRDDATPGELSTAEFVRRVLPKDKHLAFVHSLDDPDLATT